MTAMSLVAESLPALIAGAGYGRREPVIVGVHRQGRLPDFAAQGVTGAGEPLGPAVLTYAASLSKQITAACAALLVRDGVLDPEAALARWVPELPAWAGTVRLRHLVHHTAALPDAEVDALAGGTGDRTSPAVDAMVGGTEDRTSPAVDAMVGGTADRTSPAILSALARIPALARRSGTAYAYSGAGYVCLAAAVARAAGQPLPEFARERVFVPLGMSSTRFWPGPAPAPPGAAPLAAMHPAPLSLGDGGIWSTASDLLRWSQALNADELGISPLMETPGTLDDGQPVGYAWGMGIRSHAGHRVYRHGGGWPGLRALLARVPDLDVSLVILALADDTERRVDLAARLLDVLTAGPT
jgi:CubicO group peptidase (beta-lactamase class C family)